MSDYGPRGPKPESLSNEMTELTGNWESSLSHVYHHPENGPLLKKLIKKAKKKFLMESKWLDEMKEVESQLLEHEDDDDQIKRIINAARESMRAPDEDVDEEDEDQEDDDHENEEEGL